MALMWRWRTTRRGVMIWIKWSGLTFSIQEPLRDGNRKGKAQGKHSVETFILTSNFMQAVQTIIMSSQWKEVMRSSKAIPGRLGTQVPPYYDMLLAYLRLLHQVLETPMRMLIRKYPDLAEMVLDQCYKEKKNLGEGVFVDMTFEFIEDSFNYRYRCIFLDERSILYLKMAHHHLQAFQRRPTIVVSRQLWGIL